MDRELFVWSLSIFFRNGSVYKYLTLGSFIFQIVPKSRRRRPTTSDPLMKYVDDFENEREFLQKHISSQKNSEQSNRKSEVVMGSDQILSTSVNRFRVRAKPKTEITTSGNSSDISKNRDTYKVITEIVEQNKNYSS